VKSRLPTQCAADLKKRVAVVRWLTEAGYCDLLLVQTLWPLDPVHAADGAVVGGGAETVPPDPVPIAVMATLTAEKTNGHTRYIRCCCVTVVVRTCLTSIIECYLWSRTDPNHPTKKRRGVPPPATLVTSQVRHLCNCKLVWSMGW